MCCSRSRESQSQHGPRVVKPGKSANISQVSSTGHHANLSLLSITFLSIDRLIVSALPYITYDSVVGKILHPTEIRTSISPCSAVELNTTSALANYATEGLRRPYLDEVYPHLRGAIVTSNRDLKLDLPVIGSLVYCETSTLDYAAYEGNGCEVGRTDT
ncbi:unnamed protein product [Timema podura]|uniref:Uncharacterized protein n=1 Tax=Timema podura TaxID=61482 RepID=A0ABN7NCM1_TIMPD|nr:unnamed protein product [Timema podura]